MTDLIYLRDTYLFESSARITLKNQDEKGSYILLDQTIFYPQGGGQPSDQGIIQGNHFEINITCVRKIENEIRHYLGSNTSEDLKDQQILCTLNKNRRLLNAQYHTAGHLLGSVTETLYTSLKAVKGHSFPNEAYVEFQGAEMPDPSKIQAYLKKAIAAGHKTTVFDIDPKSFEQKFSKLAYPIPENKVFRVMQIKGFSPVPCGGTHLSQIDEIGHMVLRKIKSKNGIVRIAYEVT